MLASALSSLLAAFALPTVGLPAVFAVSFVSATLLPMGSEPALFGFIKLNPDWFWLGIVVATLGNTLGGAFSYLMGYGAKKVFAPDSTPRYLGWLQRFGPKTLLLSWLPVIGDPLCSVAGWLKIPFWPSLAYMALGKLVRYIVVTMLLLAVPDSVWHGLLAVR